MDALATWLVDLAFPFLAECAPIGVVGLAIALALVHKHFAEAHEVNAGDIKDVNASLSGLGAESKRVAQEVQDLSGRLDRRDAEVNGRLDRLDDRLDRLGAALQGRAFAQPAQQSNDVKPVCPLNNVVINNEPTPSRHGSSQMKDAGVSRGNELPERGRGRLNDNDERNETC